VQRGGLSPCLLPPMLTTGHSYSGPAVFLGTLLKPEGNCMAHARARHPGISPPGLGALQRSSSGATHAAQKHGQGFPARTALCGAFFLPKQMSFGMKELFGL